VTFLCDGILLNQIIISSLPQLNWKHVMWKQPTKEREKNKCISKTKSN